jgi:CMP-N-acetylneuraminic acid synthetase
MATVAALIPARGGSKGIPRKNLAVVGGKPLIAWTIEAALRSSLLNGVYVSTDDEEIARVSREYGAKVPFLRPLELASDQAGSLGVAFHALDWMAAHGGEPDYLLLLQPTSPLRQTDDIDGAIRLAEEHRAAAVVGLSVAEPHPYYARRLSTDGIVSPFIALAEEPVRRQDYPPAYCINGALYLNTPASLRADGTFEPPGALGYLMPLERSLDIDTPWQLRLADLALRS